MCLSVPQMAAAATRIRMSSGPGVGSGQSRISVPAGPSSVLDLTTASMLFVECAGHAGALTAAAWPPHPTQSEPRRSYHRVRELRPVPQVPADPAERAVDDLVGERRRPGHVVLVARQILRELMDGPDQRVA